MSTEHDVTQALTDYLNETLTPPQPVTRETDLIDAGIIDSLVIMDLLVQIEWAHGVRLLPQDITPNNFRSPTSMAQLIVERRRQLPVPALT